MTASARVIFLKLIWFLKNLLHFKSKLRFIFKNILQTLFVEMQQCTMCKRCVKRSTSAVTLTSFWCLSGKLWADFKHASIIDFEEVDAGREEGIAASTSYFMIHYHLEYYKQLLYYIYYKQIHALFYKQCIFST